MTDVFEGLPKWAEARAEELHPKDHAPVWVHRLYNYHQTCEAICKICEFQFGEFSPLAKAEALKSQSNQ